MPEAVDSLLTVMKLVGESAYRAGMVGVRTATHEVQKATQGAAVADGLFTAAQGKAAAASQVLAGAQTQASMSGKALAASQVRAAGTGTLLSGSHARVAVAAEGQAIAEAAAASATTGMSVAATAAAIALGILKAVLVAVGIAAAAVAAIGFMALRAGLNAAVGEFKKITQVGGELEATLKDVELQSGATAAEMQEIKEATLSADLANIGVAATQAAIGYKRLASEGFGVAEMQRMMLPITQATIVLGTDQNETTLLMLTLMRQFNLTAQDMTFIADNLVGALNNTSLQGDEVVGVMRSMGLAASMLNWNLSETLAVADPLVGTFGNAEMAGVYFRQMMMQLLDPTDKMAAAFKEAGLDVFDFGKNSKTAAQFVEWLRQGTWNAGLIAKAFGVRAAAAAQVMLRQTGPAIAASAKEIDVFGAAAKNATEKSKTFDGQMKALAATFANVRARLFEFTKALSTDWVTAMRLVLQSLNDYLDHLERVRQQTAETTTDGRDRVLDFAEALVRWGALSARAVIMFSSYLAQAAVWILDFVKTLDRFKLALMAVRLQWLQFRLARHPENQQLRQEFLLLRGEIEAAVGAMHDLDTAKQALLSWAGGGAVAATAQVNAWEAYARERVEQLRADMLKAMKPEGPPTEGAPTPPADKEMANEKRRAVAMRGYLAQIGEWMDTLAEAEKRQTDLIHRQWDQYDAAYATAMAAQVEAQYAQARVQWLHEAVRVTKELEGLPTPEGQEPEDRSKWAKEEQRAITAAQQAETARQKAWRDYWKEAGEARRKGEADYDRLLRKSDAVERATQRVIGGQLASEVQDALRRLADGRARVARAMTIGEGAPQVRAAGGPVLWEPAHIRGVSMGKDRIYLEVIHRGAGVTEQDRNQVLGIVFDAVENAAKKAAYQ